MEKYISSTEHIVVRRFPDIDISWSRCVGREKEKEINAFLENYALPFTSFERELESLNKQILSDLARNGTHWENERAAAGREDIVELAN